MSPFVYFEKKKKAKFFKIVISNPFQIFAVLKHPCYYLLYNRPFGVFLLNKLLFLASVSQYFNRNLGYRRNDLNYRDVTPLKLGLTNPEKIIIKKVLKSRFTKNK